METVEAHVGKMETELKQWGERLDNLMTMADVAGTRSKIDHRKRLDDLREKYLIAEAKFAELKAAGSAKWDTYREGLETAWSELEKAFTKVTN
jgi:hypothetical protein